MKALKEEHVSIHLSSCYPQGLVSLQTCPTVRRTGSDPTADAEQFIFWPALLVRFPLLVAEERRQSATIFEPELVPVIVAMAKLAGSYAGA